ELVHRLRDPARYARVGAVPPRGVLLCGEPGTRRAPSPGTGKTFAARAVASEAAKRAPCVVLIDEVDSLGEARRGHDAGDAGGGSARQDHDATLNALLAQMDGVDDSLGVLFIAATNRPEVLDEALLRTGRFEQRLQLALPDAAGREDILAEHARQLRMAGGGLDFGQLARDAAAFSPADLRGVINGAAMLTVRAGREEVTHDDVLASFQEVRRRKAKARAEGAFHVVERVEATFEDVRGHDEVVQELRDIKDSLVARHRYARLGATPPRGVLLQGPPGVGKTLCARALAGEVGLPFLSASGTDFQASRFAGHGTTLVKQLFALARKLQPCVLFIDEIDAVGRSRESGARGAEQDRENTMMQLMVELDGFTERGDTLVVGATNRPHLLDPALVRPGRFDRRVVLERPDLILELHSRGKPLAPDVDLGDLAQCTVGFSGAEIRNLLNEAALLAARRGAEAVERSDVDRAADRLLLGLEKARPVQSRAAFRLAAVHEAGHVVLGLAFAAMTWRRVVRASVRPRLGGVGGVTVFEPLPEDAEGVLPAGLSTMQGACASLCVDLGGRAAEELLQRPTEVSSGAASDLREATAQAMTMAAEWGLGPGGLVLSLPALEGRAGCSDATRREVEKAACALLSQALASARAVLGSAEGRRCMELCAQRLLAAGEVDADSLSAGMDLHSLRALACAEAESWGAERTAEFACSSLAGKRSAALHHTSVSPPRYL
ncbi:unnamed protein product, partial [Prorocentrum cordatum]